MVRKKYFKVDMTNSWFLVFYDENHVHNKVHIKQFCLYYPYKSLEEVHVCREIRVLLFVDITICTEITTSLM